MFARGFWLSPALIFFFASAAFAQGGPPLVTDDPGTPGDGHWEINIASQSASSNGSSLVQVPYFDINYGWGDRLQLKFESGGAVFSGLQSDGNQIASKAGWGGGIAGVKWRFVGDNDNASGSNGNRAHVAVSTYPQYYSDYFFSSTDPDLAQPGRWFLLPIEVSVEMGKFAVNPEAGYAFYWQGINQVWGGVVFSYKPYDGLELLAEVHDELPVSGPGASSLSNVGCRYDFTESTTLLFSVGHTLANFPADGSQFLTYLGIQLRI